MIGILFIIGLVAFIYFTAPLADRLAQRMEQKRVEREYEIERLMEENRTRYYEDYLARKNKK